MILKDPEGRGPSRIGLIWVGGPISYAFRGLKPLATPLGHHFYRYIHFVIYTYACVCMHIVPTKILATHKRMFLPYLKEILFQYLKCVSKTNKVHACVLNK